MKKIMSAKIDNLLVFGGTHGNERPGIDAIKHLRNVQFNEGVPVTLSMGNLDAIENNVRFMAQDMNRSFGDADIKGNKDNPDVNRARDILSQFEYNENRVVIDFHTTSSKAHNMLIVMEGKRDLYNLRMARYVQKSMSEIKSERPVKVFYFPGSDHPYMCPSLSPNGLGVEVGPVPHSLGNYNATQTMKRTFYSIKEFIDNNAENSVMNESIEVYRYAKTIKFPPNTVIHPDFEYQDYRPLTHGDPIFKNTITDEDITYEDTEGLCPVFINELEYVRNGNVAFHLTERNSVNLMG